MSGSIPTGKALTVPSPEIEWSQTIAIAPIGKSRQDVKS